jgi:hypothetical protein
MTIRLEILPVKFVLHNKKVEEPIKSLDRTVRLSVCSENRKSLGCLDYYVTTWFAKKHSVRTARKLATQIGLDSQSGPRFDADLTGPVNWRAGFRFGVDRLPN